MNSIESQNLAAQRLHLQHLLRLQRANIADQIAGEKGQNAHFPRSATMRFLTGRSGLSLVAGILIQRLYRRYPGTLAVSQIVRHMIL
jgi:hypothetical protein